MGPPLFWQPTEEGMRKSTLEKFRVFVNKQHGLDLKFGDYWQMHKWSITETNQFWNSLYDFAGVIGDKGAQPLFDGSRPMYDTDKTMMNLRLNWAENMLLSHEMARSKTQIAVTALIEPSPGGDLDTTFIRDLTYDQLYLEVEKAASALRKLGVTSGDRVAALSPNNAEAVVMVLATNSIGAIWSSSPPEFGVSAILERFTQLKPKVLLSADKYRVGGKDIDILPKLKQVVEALIPGGLKTVIVVGQLEKDRRPKAKLPEYKGVKSISYPDFLDKNPTKLTFWRGPAHAPIWVLYSSGTTGKPKAIVHNQAGMTFEMKKQGLLHSGYKAGDVQIQVTTTGWMMWNQMVNHLCLGMQIIVYDGSPFAPHRSFLWDLVDKYNVSSFSLSPRYLQILATEGVVPKKTHKLKYLRSLFTAGSPVKPEMYEYCRDCIKNDIFMNNGTGGTDVCSAFLGACPWLPIYAGVIQVPMLGMNIECFDDNAQPLTNGEEGDMVITVPFPNMPLGLLGDDENKTKLKETYFNHYTQRCVWYQADYMKIHPESKGLVVLGRSDGVLNPGGVRFGSAELYAIVEEMKDAVEDCIAVGQKYGDGDERVILFVKPLNGAKLTEQLRQRIRKAIGEQLSRRHVPAKIIECQDIPYTVNLKKVEVAVKKVVNGQAPSSLNTSGMLNPQSLNFFVNHPELALPKKAGPKAQAKL